MKKTIEERVREQIKKETLAYVHGDRPFFKVHRFKSNGVVTFVIPDKDENVFPTMFTLEKKIAKDVAKFMVTGIKPKN